MNPGVEAIKKLEALGYHPHLEGDSISLEHEGQNIPDPNQVRQLLALVKENKAEVMIYLARKSQDPPERILLCSECPWHRDNPWTHYPELPAWCDWHFDHLAADNPACIGYRRGDIPKRSPKTTPVKPGDKS